MLYQAGEVADFLRDFKEDFSQDEGESTLVLQAIISMLEVKDDDKKLFTDIEKFLMDGINGERKNATLWQKFSKLVQGLCIRTDEWHP